MEFLGWMYDIAREQSPVEHVVREMLERSAAAGYNAVGLYLEHRFAYPSAPWAAGPGCLTPDAARGLIKVGRARNLRIVPFLNTLGHMEGFIRSAGGEWLAEGPSGFGGEQICAARPECAAFARALVADALAVFDDEWVHLGGDETQQLGQCPACAARVAQVGKDGLYGEYFGALCRFVLEHGRRPCLWGDMLLQHPRALDALPPQTIIFDWQYFSPPHESTALFRRQGFDVVCCPSVQTYNSGWCFLNETQQNIDAHAADARALGALGVLVTTWEFSYFSQYAAVLPLVYAAGRRLARGATWPAAIDVEGGPGYAEAAELLGNRVPAASTFLRPGTWRQLRQLLVIRRDPFELWSAWRSEACGAAGDTILHLCDQADAALPAGHPLRFASELHRAAVQCVRCIEAAREAYAANRLFECATQLDAGRAALARLGPGLAAAVSSGGSAADVRRLGELLARMTTVHNRVAELPAGSAHRPAFETLVRDGYLPGDQAAWCTRWATT